MQVSYLGPLSVRDGSGATVEIAGGRLRTLLARLAVDVGTAVGTGELTSTVWDDVEPASPHNALQALVSRLRRVLGSPGLVEQVAGGYRLAVAPECVDAVRVARAVAGVSEARRAGDGEQAVQLADEALAQWSGDVLAGEPGSFADLERRRLAVVHDRLLTERWEALLDRSQAQAVVRELGDAVAAAPLREDLAELLIRALTDLGRTGEALAVFERTRASLADELGADPSAALRAGHARALAVPAEDSAAPTNITEAVNGLLGRDADLADLGALLRTARLVTVLGPGGAGKTRIATEAGRLAVGPPGPAGGVWFVEFAPVVDPAELDLAVLDALGARELVRIEGGRIDRVRVAARARLVERLAGSPTVLVLDNCEHVVDAAADLVTDLLARCGGLRVLATSREPLAVDGEHLFPLMPLDVPAAGADPTAAADSPAVQLLLERSGAAGAAVVLDETTVGPLCEIARRLDGLPLALELAAARLRSLTPAEVAARLDDRFRLLTGGRRTAVARHRTLRAVVEWSWDLLGPDERELAEQCGVFVGGATAASVAAVLDIPLADAQDRLLGLVDRSILTATERSGVTRFRMLETLREFGRERLAARGALTGARDRHAAHLRRVAREADAGLRSAAQRRSLATLDVERDDVAAALAHLVESGNAAGALELATSLGWYGVLREETDDVGRMCRAALSVPGAGAEPLAPLAEGFVAVSEFPTLVGRGTDAAGPTRMIEAARALAGFPGRRAAVLRTILVSFGNRSDLAAQAVAAGLADPDPWTRAAVRAVRVTVAENAGELAAVRAEVATAIEEWTQVGDDWGLAGMLSTRAGLRTMSGDLDGAVADLLAARERLSALGGTGDDRLISMRLADLKARRGDLAGARAEIAAVRAPGTSSFGGQAFAILGAASAVTVELTAGSPEAARAALRRLDATLSEQRTLGNLERHGAAVAAAVSAAAHARIGDPSRSGPRLLQALDFALQTDDGPIVAVVAGAAATVAHRAGADELAARLVGTADRLRGVRDVSDPSLLLLTAGLRERLGEWAEQLRTEGADDTREQALARLADAVRALAADPEPS